MSIASRLRVLPEERSIPGGPAAEALAREPYRLLFPIGIALAWAGVGHWLLYLVGAIDQLHSVFHAITQVQGFLTAFAVGFLFTMIPRRTNSDPPALWQLVIGALCPIAITISAWFEQWAFSQVFWLLLMAVMLGFVLRRARLGRAKRRPPNSFVWIPIALITGIAGSVLTGFGAALGEDHWWLHDLGRRMVLQGVFVSLVLGVGGLAIPLMTRGEAPPDATFERRDRYARLLHLVAALLFVASFLLERWAAVRGVMFLRGAIITSVLLLSAELNRPPQGRGLNRRLIWTAAWMLPLGYFLAGIFDQNYKAGLHVTFIGGFSLLTLAVSAQVTLGHGGFGSLLAQSPRRLMAVAAAMLLALVARVLMEADAERYFFWMGTASTLFLGATAAWIALTTGALGGISAVSRLRGAPRS